MAALSSHNFLDYAALRHLKRQSFPHLCLGFATCITLCVCVCICIWVCSCHGIGLINSICLCICLYFSTIRKSIQCLLFSILCAFFVFVFVFVFVTVISTRPSKSIYYPFQHDRLCGGRDWRGRQEERHLQLGGQQHILWYYDIFWWTATFTMILWYTLMGSNKF